MYERFNDEARNAVAKANQVADAYNHEYIGTEHMLLALAESLDCLAYRILKIMGIPAAILVEDVKKLITAGPPMVVQGKRPVTPRMKRIIECAMEEARNENAQTVGTEHLLLGLLREEEGVGGQVLRDNHVTLENVRLIVAEMRRGVYHVTDKDTDRRGAMQALAEYVKQLAGELGFNLGEAEPLITTHLLRFENFEWRVPNPIPEGTMDIRELVQRALEERMVGKQPAPWRPESEDSLAILDANGKWVCNAHDIDIRNQIINAVNRPTVEHWRGIGKLVEEMGELLQLLGKVIAYPTGDHPDGKGALKDRLPLELADVEAALYYFEQQSGIAIETVIHPLVLEKLSKFRTWGLPGVSERSA